MVDPRDRSTLPVPLQEKLASFEHWRTRLDPIEDEAHSITTPVYHYTASAGPTILRSNTILTFDVASLSDTNELTYGLGHACKLLTAAGKRASPERQRFFGVVILSIEKATTEFRYFSASFCATDTNAHLWKEYAGNGKGVAIGILPSQFNPGQLDPDPAQNVITRRMRYSRDGLHKAMKKTVTRYGQVFSDRNLLRLSQMQIEMLARLLGPPLVMDLLLAALPYKEEHYRPERETRLGYFFPRGVHDHLIKSSTINGSSRDTVPFVFDPPLYGDGLAEILLGPNVSPENQNGVEEFVRKHGIDRSKVRKVNIDL